MLIRLLPLAFAVFLQGCFIIGTAVGSAVPKYETLKEGDDIPLGESVVVDRKDETEASYRPVEGALARVDPSFIDVESSDGKTTRIPQTAVDRVRVEKKGNYWVTGFLIGGCFDVTAAVLSMALLSTAMNQSK